MKYKTLYIPKRLCDAYAKATRAMKPARTSAKGAVWEPAPLVRSGAAGSVVLLGTGGTSVDRAGDAKVGCTTVEERTGC